MQVLLLEDVRKLGHLGDVVDVKSGYARNYLVPYHKATEPTEENINAIAESKKRADSDRAARMKKYQALVDQLQDVSVTIQATANEDGTLYGSVGAKEISEALAEEGHTIAASHIILGEPIRTLDNRDVRVEFTDDVSTTVKVWVVREGELPGEEEPVAEGASEESDGEPTSDEDAE